MYCLDWQWGHDWVSSKSTQTFDRGYILSPILLTILIDFCSVAAQLQRESYFIWRRFRRQNSTPFHLREELQYNINELSKVGERTGLAKCTQKTKIMRNNVNKLPAEPLIIKENDMEEVRNLDILGVYWAPIGAPIVKWPHYHVRRRLLWQVKKHAEKYQFLFKDEMEALQ